MTRKTFIYLSFLLLPSFIGLGACGDDNESNCYVGQVTVLPPTSGTRFTVRLLSTPSGTFSLEEPSPGQDISFPLSNLPAQDYSLGTVFSFRIKEYHKVGLTTADHTILYFCVVEPCQ